MEAIYGNFAGFGLRKAKHAERLVDFTEEKIIRLLERHKELITAIGFPQPSERGSIDILPDSWDEPIPGDTIKQLALYVNRVLLHDPFLNFLDQWKNLRFAPASAPSHRDPEAKRQELVGELKKAITDFLDIEPLVKAGIVSLVPSRLLLPPKEAGILHTKDFYGPSTTGYDVLGDGHPADKLPEPILNYANENLKIYPVEIKDKPVIHLTGKLTPRRIIAVMFENDPYPMIYNLFAVRVVDREKRMVEVVLQFDGGPPIDEDSFNTWVEGTRKEYLIVRISALQRDLLIAAGSGAKFLTSIPASRDLVQLDIEPPKEAPAEDAVIKTLMTIKLPYFESVNPGDLVRARKNEAAFEEFRVALDRAFKELRDLSGEELRLRVPEIERDILSKPVATIGTRMKSLHRNLFVEAGKYAGTLTAILLAGNPLTTIGGGLYLFNKVMSAYKELKKEEDSIKQLPSFFYWEATKKARRRYRWRKS